MKAKVWWHKLSILALRKQKHADLCEFKAILVCIESGKLGRSGLKMKISIQIKINY